ncbi:MAG: isochorismatase family cysteine hydrolase [Bacteroidota bacterium]|nr:isochorismatase family cysteine hydrolase [Bacteroidota bacterium]
MKEEYFSKTNIEEVSQAMRDKAFSYSRKRQIELAPDRCALLVLDMQYTFLSQDSKAFIPSSAAIIERIENLKSVAEKYNIPIIYTRHLNDEKDAGMMNTWWIRMIRREDPLSEIIYQGNIEVIEKSQYDIFYQTELDKRLEKLGRDQLIMCGVMTNLCCETSMRSSFVRGYEAVLPVDTTATYTQELHQASLLNLALGFSPPMLSSDLINQLKNGRT